MLQILQLLLNNIEKLLNLFLNRKQKDLLSDMEPQDPQDANLILVRYDKVENISATGRLFFRNFEIAFKSGGYGKGAAPKGEYTAHSYMDIAKDFPNSDAYSKFGIGFFVRIDAEFPSDRKDLGIHFDGNVPGTLGCIGLQCSNLDDAVKVRNLFRDALSDGQKLECRII